MNSARRRLAITAVAVLAVAPLGLGLYALARPHRDFPPGPPPGLETWVAVSGRHNSNTDLVRWRDAFWLAHAAAPWHFASTSTRIVLRRSEDARSWSEVASFSSPGEDVRDPKLAAIGERLFLYFLPNRHFPEPQPCTTLVTSSVDGRRWEPAVELDPPGWLLWHPRTRDGLTFLAAAYWHEHGEAALLRSTDGRRWEKVSTIARGRSVDETDIEILADGRILAVSRAEGSGHDTWFGDPGGGTILSTAAPPYTEWSRVFVPATRLDGPCLFSWNGRVYAIARGQPGGRGCLFETGSILARKRTALYLVGPSRLRLLGFLPSAGDTSYPGVALHDGQLYASYYTSRIDRDYPWVLGMLLPSEVRIARLPFPVLESLAARD